MLARLSAASGGAQGFERVCLSAAGGGASGLELVCPSAGSGRASGLELVCPSAASGGASELELVCLSAAGGAALELELVCPSAAGCGAFESELVCLSAAGGGTLSVECCWFAFGWLASERLSWSWPAPRRLGVEQESCSAAPRRCAAVGLALDSVGIIRFVCREFWLSCGIILLQLWLASLWCDLWRLASRRLGPCG